MMTKEKEKVNIKSLKQVPHLGPVSEKRLGAIGIFTMRGIYTQLSATTLSSITGMDLTNATEAMLFIGDVLEQQKKIPKRHQTAWELYLEQENEGNLSTGCESFDQILGGGIKSGYVTEIYGENKSGKTQTCISLVVSALVKNPECIILYIDTENKIKTRRFVEILLARQIITELKDAQSYLDRIKVWQPTNSDEELNYVTEASQKLDNDDGPEVGLFVIDSIISLFQSEYMERGEMKAKFNMIKPMMLNLMKLSHVYKFPIVVVNTVHKSPTELYGADPIIAAGGNSVGHPLTYRIKVREVGSGKKHRALMVKSPEHPESEADFIITDKGIENVE